MKTLLKQLFVVAALIVVAAPAHAAGINKGSKSYQKADKAETETAAAAQPSSAEDVADIAPAAGATDEAVEAPSKSEKSLRDDIRLPRKN